MDLYNAVVTTTPFLLVALLVDLRVFGPMASRRTRVERRYDWRTDRQVVIFLGFGFASALLGLATGWDNGYLRCAAAVGLAVGAMIVFFALWRDIETLYAPDNAADDASRHFPVVCRCELLRTG